MLKAASRPTLAALGSNFPRCYGILADRHVDIVVIGLPLLQKHRARQHRHALHLSTIPASACPHPGEIPGQSQIWDSSTVQVFADRTFFNTITKRIRSIRVSNSHSGQPLHEISVAVGQTIEIDVFDLQVGGLKILNGVKLSVLQCAVIFE